MATIAIVPSDVRSKRMLAERLGDRLAGAGHHVVQVVPVAPAGVEDGADDVPPSADGRVRWRTVELRPPDGVRRRFRPLAQWRAVRDAASAIDPARLAAVLDEVAADLVVIDVEEFEAMIAALALPRRPPIAALCSFFEPWPISGIGPDDPGPARGPAVYARVRARLAWWRLWARMRLYGWKQHATGTETDRVAIARALARRLGVRSELSERQWLHPFVPHAVPMLVCNALELDVPHTPRPGVAHIGSLLAPIGDELDGTALGAALDEAVAEHRPVVVCSFGTVMGGGSALVERLREVALLRPDHLFVVATGEPADPGRGDSTDRPANVHLVPWLPQREVLARAAAAIVHSGNATLHECVAAGVPVLVYPFAVNDQRRNSARVVRHGIGLVGDRDADHAATIADRLDRVIADGEWRRRAERLAPDVLRYEHDGVAVAEVEALLGAADRHVTDAGRSPPSS